jgi:hypothetical protein
VKNAQLLESFILVRDDFFSDPGGLRNEALSARYEEPGPKEGWIGFRAGELPGSAPVVKAILAVVRDHFSLQAAQYAMESHYHYCLESTRKKAGRAKFERRYLHKDPTVLAGVVYLCPDAPKSAGTTIVTAAGRRIRVENVFNRLVCYPGCFIHGPTDAFGSTVADGRLTLTFYVSAGAAR